MVFLIGYAVLFEVCVVVACLALCHGYKSGAPQGACATMMPLHNDTTAQTNAAPYTITVSKTTYKKGDTIEVTLTSSTNFFFQGFFLQARTSDSNTNAMGVFSFSAIDDEMKIIKCPDSNSKNNAVTHTIDNHTTSKQVLWTNADGGDVYFQATMVNHRTTFWTGVKSATVKYNAASTVALSAWMLIGLLLLRVL